MHYMNHRAEGSDGIAWHRMDRAGQLVSYLDRVNNRRGPVRPSKPFIMFDNNECFERTETVDLSNRDGAGQASGKRCESCVQNRALSCLAWWLTCGEYFAPELLPVCYSGATAMKHKPQDSAVLLTCPVSLGAHVAPCRFLQQAFFSAGALGSSVVLFLMHQGASVDLSEHGAGSAF